MDIKELIELAKQYQPTEEQMKAMFERAEEVQKRLDDQIPLQLP